MLPHLHLAIDAYGAAIADAVLCPERLITVLPSHKVPMSLCDRRLQLLVLCGLVQNSIYRLNIATLQRFSVQLRLFAAAFPHCVPCYPFCFFENAHRMSLQ